MRVIDWLPDGGVRLLDQTRLPAEEVYVDVRTVEEMAEAIQQLKVRGAPLIGIAAAMGLAAAAAREAERGSLTREWVEIAASRLAAERPTAVNLRWAVERVRVRAAAHFERAGAAAGLVAALTEEAQRIWDEDVAMCRAIGEAGAALIPPGSTVLTHCNAGMLATGGLGTALAAVYVAHRQGKDVQVVSCETRPLRQGARLTTWELARNGVPVRTVVDGAAAALMAQGAIDLVVTGADRIAANGDVANKIGTYGLAVLAEAHGIPFYVAAPRSTFDAELASGDLIPIEQRPASEMEVAAGAEVVNPAFDVTPAELINGIITDRGVLAPPYGEPIRELLGR
ncbi:MAG: S-methyl-5-thioribose-1-phosphate isomerase [Gemmatimonadota bacterium]|nr:MAG: S-methyl-5-thioribose-1-phosphate isomerase [Gemmatimonadota bacterium]